MCSKWRRAEVPAQRLEQRLPCEVTVTSYHQRRPEKTISDETEMLDVIAEQGIMTLAMSKDNEPYLVTVNYGFDEAGRCFYFHCGKVGKKIDYLKANPVVWGQVLEDNGYIDGECNHAFRSVHFRGRVTFLESDADRRHAISLMIDHLESNPETVKQRFAKPDALDDAVLVRVQVEEMTAKENPAPKRAHKDSD
jgi:nitroimidazol reductase NimA-like FMN-containing flavoprotein (pyridoxamine 5'-phosphate oxidase superfamily)